MEQLGSLTRGPPTHERGRWSQPQRQVKRGSRRCALKGQFVEQSAVQVGMVGGVVFNQILAAFDRHGVHSAADFQWNV